MVIMINTWSGESYGWWFRHSPDESDIEFENGFDNGSDNDESND